MVGEETSDTPGLDDRRRDRSIVCLQWRLNSLEFSDRPGGLTAGASPNEASVADGDPISAQIRRPQLTARSVGPLRHSDRSSRRAAATVRWPQPHRPATRRPSYRTRRKPL